MVDITEVNDDTDTSGDGVRHRGEENGNVVATADGGEGEVEVVEPSFNEQVDRAREAMQPTPMEKFMAIAKSLILRALVIYFVMSFIRSNSSPKTPSTAVKEADGSWKQAPVLTSSNVYANGTEFDIYLYASEDSYGIKTFDGANLLWKLDSLVYGDWYGGPSNDGVYTQTCQVQLSERVQNNGSIYLHSYVVPTGFSPDPKSTTLKYSKSQTIHSSKMLNRFKRKRYAKTHNLITGETSASVEDQEKAKIMSSEIVSHWHPNMTLNLVMDWTAWTAGQVPPPLGDYLQFNLADQTYKPALFFNDYWNLRKDYEPINQTLSEIPLTLTFQPLSTFKWQLYAAQSARSQWNMFPTGEDDDEEQDTLKEAILDTNPYLLGLTFVVSVLHSIFEFLAFKNDIQFWNNRKSLEGLSVRSVVFGVFQSLVVLLYVLDNDTNFVIRMSVFVGLLIELWKINKVMDVTVDRTNRVLGIFPRLKFADKGSYVESSTRQYDIMAFRYLSWAVFPLLFGYAVYSLLYVEQKGWYSWVLSMLYGFLLTFGFIMMTPQLFINYKLKSVAHLPWRMLSYKFLNTFIDDIFAFVIKMPTLYRIGTLRDDVIFFIFLYQRYIYRIDPSRLNEFGFSAEMLEEKAKADREKAQLSGVQPQPAIEASEGSGTVNGTKSKKDKKHQ